MQMYAVPLKSSTTDVTMQELHTNSFFSNVDPPWSPGTVGCSGHCRQVYCHGLAALTCHSTTDASAQLLTYLFSRCVGRSSDAVTRTCGWWPHHITSKYVIYTTLGFYRCSLFALDEWSTAVKILHSSSIVTLTGGLVWCEDNLGCPDTHWHSSVLMVVVQKFWRHLFADFSCVKLSSENLPDAVPIHTQLIFHP